MIRQMQPISTYSYRIFCRLSVRVQFARAKDDFEYSGILGFWAPFVQSVLHTMGKM